MLLVRVTPSLLVTEGKHCVVKASGMGKRNYSIFELNLRVIVGSEKIVNGRGKEIKVHVVGVLVLVVDRRSVSVLLVGLSLSLLSVRVSVE